MVSSCIKGFLLLQSVRAACTGNSTSCNAPSDFDEVTFVQRRANKLGGTWQRKVHGGEDIVDLYLDAVRDSISGVVLRTPGIDPAASNDKGASLTRHAFDAEKRKMGDEWCEYCYSMVGTARLDNVRLLMDDVIAHHVTGDFIETGVWRGGSSIMARAVQRARGEQETRRVYACDSFEGLPPASQSKDENRWSEMDFLKVSVEEVKMNFATFQLLDNGIHFVKGYFQDSLPLLRQELKAEHRQLAVLRGDGDMYESYLDILYNLYEFIPVGGYFICDDCPTIQPAEDAVADFRREHGITEKIIVLDSHMGSFWQKKKAVEVKYDKYIAWNATRHA